MPLLAPSAARLCLAAWLVAALVACDGAIGLYDPLGATERPFCLTDDECVEGRCDPADHRCHPCVEDADCRSPSLVCVAHACEQAVGRCDSNLDCGRVPGKPFCDTTDHTCYPCLADADCGSATCANHACQPLPGCVAADVDPAGTTTLSDGTRALKGEASASDFQACVDARCCVPRPADPPCTSAAAPANCVSARDAIDYCAYRKARVPTSAEWSRLVGGRQPWGDAPAPDGKDYAVLEGSGFDAPQPACSKAKGSTPAGLCDLVGNLWEWTSDSPVFPCDDPQGCRVLRGGSFLTRPSEGLAADTSYARGVATRLVDAGIRCVW